MLTTKDIANRYDLSPKQVRSFMDAVSPVLANDIARGPHNTILIQESAVHVLDRAMELRREGVSWTDIGSQLADEMSDLKKHSSFDNNALDGQTVNEQAPKSSIYGRPDAPPPDETIVQLLKTKDELVDELRQQIAELKGDKDLLQSRVRDLEQLALPTSSEGRRKLSLGQRIKVLLSGEV